MKVLPLMAAIYAGFVITVVYGFVLGEAGLVSYYDLLRRREILEDNIGALSEINHSLSQELENLGSDSETIRLIARELGYYRSDEKIVEVIGIPQRSQSYTVGSLVQKMNLKAEPETPLRTLLFVAPALIYISVALLRKKPAHGHHAR